MSTAKRERAAREGFRKAAHRPAQREEVGDPAHIEHVFAEQKARMGLFVRTIGLARATVYNMRRLRWLKCQPAFA